MSDLVQFVSLSRSDCRNPDHLKSLKSSNYSRPQSEIHQENSDPCCSASPSNMITITVKMTDNHWGRVSCARQKQPNQAALGVSPPPPPPPGTRNTPPSVAFQLSELEPVTGLHWQPGKEVTVGSAVGCTDFTHLSVWSQFCDRASLWPQDTHTTSKQLTIHALYISPFSSTLLGVFPQYRGALFSRSLVSLENCKHSPSEMAVMRDLLLSPLWSPAQRSPWRKTGFFFFFYSGMMELEKVHCKFLQTIVRQRRRHRERQKQLSVLV